MKLVTQDRVRTTATLTPPWPVRCWRFFSPGKGRVGLQELATLMLLMLLSLLLAKKKGSLPRPPPNRLCAPCASYTRPFGPPFGYSDCGSLAMAMEQEIVNDKVRCLWALLATVFFSCGLTHRSLCSLPDRPRWLTHMALSNGRTDEHGSRTLLVA